MAGHLNCIYRSCGRNKMGKIAKTGNKCNDMSIFDLFYLSTPSLSFSLRAWHGSPPTFLCQRKQHEVLNFPSLMAWSFRFTTPETSKESCLSLVHLATQVFICRPLIYKTHDGYRLWYDKLQRLCLYTKTVESPVTQVKPSTTIDPFCRSRARPQVGVGVREFFIFLILRSRFLRRLRSDLTRSLLYLKNEFGATLNVLRTGFRSFGVVALPGGALLHGGRRPGRRRWPRRHRPRGVGAGGAEQAAVKELVLKDVATGSWCWNQFLKYWNLYLRCWNLYLRCWNQFLRSWNHFLRCWNLFLRCWNRSDLTRSLIYLRNEPGPGVTSKRLKNWLWLHSREILKNLSHRLPAKVSGHSIDYMDGKLFLCRGRRCLLGTYNATARGEGWALPFLPLLVRFLVFF